MSDAKDSSKSSDGKPSFTYQSSKVPWWIHVMWISFFIWGIAYLYFFALKDFIRWW